MTTLRQSRPTDSGKETYHTVVKWWAEISRRLGITVSEIDDLDRPVQ